MANKKLTPDDVGRIQRSITPQQEIDPDTGEVVWTSPIEKKFKSDTDGLSLIELIEQNRIVDEQGTPCPPPDNTVQGNKAKSEYYHKWLTEQMMHGGVQFYRNPLDTLPVGINYNPRSKSFKINRVPAKPKLKKPGWFNRRRDRKLREKNLPGTPEMRAYRAALQKQEEAAIARQNNARLEKEKQKQLKSVNYLKTKSLNELQKLSKMDPAKFDSKARESMMNHLTNLMMCDGYRRMEKSNPNQADSMLMRKFNLYEDYMKHPKSTSRNMRPVDVKAFKAGAVFNDGEQDIVKKNLGKIKSPADLAAFLNDGGRGKLVNAYFLNNRLQQKQLLRPEAVFATGEMTQDGQPKYDEVAKKNYDRLCSKAEEALARLKQIGASKDNIPDYMEDKVRDDLALVVLHNVAARVVGGNAPDAEFPRQFMSLLGDELPANANAGQKTDLDDAVKTFRDTVISKVNVADMTGADLGKFLCEGHDGRLAREYVRENQIHKTGKAPVLNTEPERVKEQEYQQYMLG